MDWNVYWFMFPVCIAVAAIAMFSGISGAALLIPVFLIGFPLAEVPGLTTVEAVGTALFLETSGFGMGLYRYLTLRLVDVVTAWRLVMITLPLGMLGAVASAQAPVGVLRIGYGLAMVVLAFLLVREPHPAASVRSPHGDTLPPGGAFAPATSHDHPPCPRGSARRITPRDGRVFVYCLHGLRGQQVISGVGAFFAGLISTGVGEATLPGLVQRSRVPVMVAAATSTVVVAGTVVGAALTHMVQLAAVGGLAAIPWNLIVWAVPGAVLGAYLGTGLQGRVSPTMTRWSFGALFLLIGIAFLLAFTVFSERFT